MKFNWKQSGMPVSLVSRLGLKNEFADYKSVLSDAQNQVMTTIDAEAMAKELVQSGGHEYVEVVRELTTALANTRQELESANRRYERLTADLARRGIPLGDEVPLAPEAAPAAEPPAPEADPAADSEAEWEEWNRRFQSLLG